LEVEFCNHSSLLLLSLSIRLLERGDIIITRKKASQGAANGPCVRSEFFDFDLDGKLEFDLEIEGQGQQWVIRGK